MKRKRKEIVKGIRGRGRSVERDVVGRGRRRAAGSGGIGEKVEHEEGTM